VGLSREIEQTFFATTQWEMRQKSLVDTLDNVKILMENSWKRVSSLGEPRTLHRVSLYILGISQRIFIIFRAHLPACLQTGTNLLSEERNLSANSRQGDALGQ
jgi:hypothetical protein